MEHEEDTQVDAAPARRSVGLRTWLLLALLVAVALLARDLHPRVGFSHANQEPPPVVEATGELAEAYRVARPATLRIEGRCSNPLLGRSPVGIGTGFFISPDGQVLTAYHVVQRQGLQQGLRCRLRYFAVDPLEREFPLELVAFDAYLDLALMQAQVGGEVPYIGLADSLPKVGSEVVAVGNSRGDFLEDRSGRVTRLGVRARQANFASDTIELTAALQPGDSGGPVLDSRGRALGVVSYISFNPAVMSSDEQHFVPFFMRGLTPPAFASYAVPVLEGSETLAALRAGVQRDVPVIGFEAAFDYDPRLQGSGSLGGRPGVVVGRVQDAGPAAAAGLRSLEQRQVFDASGAAVGTTISADVIVAVDGKPTPTFNRLLEVVRDRDIGETVSLTVQRGNALLELDLTLAAYRQVFNQ